MRHFTHWMLAVAVVAAPGCEMSELTPSADASVSADTAPVCQLKVWHPDADGDKYGSSDPALAVEACDAPPNHLEDNSDCNDAAKTVHPGAPESCNNVDDDCNGHVDDTEQSWWLDADGDGFGDPKFEHTGPCTGVESWFVANSSDCNDGDMAISPIMAEKCDGIDNNCNGEVDEGVKSEFRADVDGDGHGSSDPGKIIMACAPSKEVVVSSDDCDDTDKTVYAGAPELCDNIDNNCNGEKDEGAFLMFYKDSDGDGHGDPNQTLEACDAPVGATVTSDDCNDDPLKGGAAIYPGAKESCNMIDDNCDGQTDENVQTVYHEDTDGDGYGDPKSKITLACAAPPGMAFASGDDFADCDDADPNVHPGAKEICDGKVNSCSGKLVEPNSLCEDGDKFTQDKCGGEGGCVHVEQTLLLDCSLSPDFKKADGYACSVAYMYELGPQKYSPMVTGTDSVTLFMKDVCAMLKGGATLNVNSYAFIEIDKAAMWQGGEFTKLIDSFTNAAAGGIPGNVTLGAGLDFNYTVAEIDACK